MYRGRREGGRERERERDREKNNAGETNIDPDMPGRKGGKKLPRDFAAMFDITENPYLYICITTHTHTHIFIYLPPFGLTPLHRQQFGFAGRAFGSFGADQTAGFPGLEQII